MCLIFAQKGGIGSIVGSLNLCSNLVNLVAADKCESIALRTDDVKVMFELIITNSGLFLHFQQMKMIISSGTINSSYAQRY